MREISTPQRTHTMHVLALRFICDDQIPKRSSIAVSGPMSLELLDAKEIGLVAHPFDVVHLCGVAGG